MIRKLLIEADDKKKIKMWDQRRKNSLDEYINFLRKDIQEYIIGFDIASPNSKDQSIMMKFRLVDGKYVYDGCETI